MWPATRHLTTPTLPTHPSRQGHRLRTSLDKPLAFLPPSKTKIQTPSFYLALLSSLSPLFTTFRTFYICRAFTGEMVIPIYSSNFVFLYYCISVSLLPFSFPFFSSSLFSSSHLIFRTLRYILEKHWRKQEVLKHATRNMEYLIFGLLISPSIYACLIFSRCIHERFFAPPPFFLSFFLFFHTFSQQYTFATFFYSLLADFSFFPAFCTSFSLASIYLGNNFLFVNALSSFRLVVS